MNKVITNGCGAVLGLVLLYVWFQVHWESALTIIVLFFAWVFLPVLWEETKHSKPSSNKSDLSNKGRNSTLLTFETVPEFKQYFPSSEAMSVEQLEFYNYWQDSWQNRNAIDINGQLSYVFCYAYDVINSNDHSRIIRELSDLRESYRDEDKLPRYLGGWIGDALILEGRFTDALKFEISIDKRLSLKLALNIPVTSDDLSLLQKPRLTKHGAKYVRQIMQIADKKLGLIQLSSDEHLLAQFVKAKLEHGQYSFFNGVRRPTTKYTISIDARSGEVISKTNNKVDIDDSKSAKLYYFKASKELSTFSKSLFRDAENYLREEQGVPLIGEGWVSETSLYYSIKDEFSDTEVIHHGKPKWLGRQHLDIFIPKFNVGVEYQGSQHQKPIEFFGGESAFKKTVERDKKKKMLCLKNNCKLIYVFPNYDFEDVKKEILDAMKNGN